MQISYSLNKEPLHYNGQSINRVIYNGKTIYPLQSDTESTKIVTVLNLTKKEGTTLELFLTTIDGVGLNKQVKLMRGDSLLTTLSTSDGSLVMTIPNQ